MSFDLSREMQVAVELARRAGRTILELYAADVPVDYKGRGKSDPVTEADRRANSIIVQGLAAAFPSDAILAEESPLDPERHRRERLWCVDPLDGTREFIDKNGQFVVMIGLAILGEARLGVVYQPTTDTLFAGAEHEAYVERANGRQPLVPSTLADPKQATMHVSRSHRSATVSRIAERLGIPREKPLGSVGLKVAQVALGAADLYLSVSNQTHEWDACAPAAILNAAGGVCSDCLGRPLTFNKPTTETPYGILATNGPLHPLVVEALRPVVAERGWA